MSLWSCWLPGECGALPTQSQASRLFPGSFPWEFGSPNQAIKAMNSFQGTLPETNIFAPGGWKTIVSFWGPAYFQVRTVSFGEGIRI